MALPIGALFLLFPCILGQDICGGTEAASLRATMTLLVFLGTSVLVAGLVARRERLWKHWKEFEGILRETHLLTEVQALEMKSADGWESFVLYDAGIVQMPTLAGIYLGIWFIGLIIMFVFVTIVGHFASFVVFPRSGPTFLGSFVFLLQLLIPAVPIMLLEMRRRRGGGKQTIERAIERGQAKLIRWEDVTRVELKPIRAGESRPGYGNWAMTVLAGKKKFNGRHIKVLQGEDWVDMGQIGPIEGFLRNKVGEKLWVFERKGLRTGRVR